MTFSQMEMQGWAAAKGNGRGKVSFFPRCSPLVSKPPKKN